MWNKFPLIIADKRAYILTEDKDFGDELVFRKIAHSGAMLLRLAGVNIEDKIRLVFLKGKNLKIGVQGKT